ncbi:uncharacterized protein LOC143904825 isoform X2 [Temnothorax americanus]|uniref:uncharacterized protein LOC143904825 isoform X2 n=1 Tax=Temnothorax americanus TaxID=1964332 RepID=UPI00406961CE
MNGEHSSIKNRANLKRLQEQDDNQNLNTCREHNGLRSTRSHTLTEGMEFEDSNMAVTFDQFNSESARRNLHSTSISRRTPRKEDSYDCPVIHSIPLDHLLIRLSARYLLQH